MDNSKTFKYNINLDNKFTDIAYRLQDDQPYCQGYHYHEGCEIMQIWSNEGYVLVEDKIYPIKKGHIYIINALESHYTNPAVHSTYVRSKITFSTSYIRDQLDLTGQLPLLDPFLNKGGLFTHMISPDALMMDQFDRLFKEIQCESINSCSGDITNISAYILQMLVSIYRWYEKSSQVIYPGSNVNEHITNVMSYINANLLEDLTIDDICHQHHLNKYYLCHLFKRMTGITIIQYINDRRISLAKKLLSSTNLPISEIAIQSGFSSFSLFSRSFKRIAGYTPNEYRRKFTITGHYYR